MKAKIKTLLVIAGTAIALVAASQSVNPAAKRVKKQPNVPCYSEEDVQLLMKANHWNRVYAVEALELSCLASEMVQ